MNFFVLFFLALRRTVRRFSAWRFATSRVYSYTLPTYAFANPWDVSEKYRITAGVAYS